MVNVGMSGTTTDNGKLVFPSYYGYSQLGTFLNGTIEGNRAYFSDNTTYGTDTLIPLNVTNNSIVEMNVGFVNISEVSDIQHMIFSGKSAYTASGEQTYGNGNKFFFKWGFNWCSD